MNVSESLLDAPEVGVGPGRALGAVPEDPVPVGSMLCGTGLERSHPGYFCIPVSLVSPQTTHRQVENSDGILPHTVQHLLRSKLVGGKRKGTKWVSWEHKMPWDVAHADFKGRVGYSAEGQCELSYIEVAPCCKSQNPCSQMWGR